MTVYLLSATLTGTHNMERNYSVQIFWTNGTTDTFNKRAANKWLAEDYVLDTLGLIVDLGTIERTYTYVG